jgi:hypothetical protein
MHDLFLLALTAENSLSDWGLLGERKYINRELALKAMLRLDPALRCAFLLHKTGRLDTSADG